MATIGTSLCSAMKVVSTSTSQKTAVASKIATRGSFFDQDSLSYSWKNANKNNPQRTRETQLGTIQSKNWGSDLIVNASLFHIDFIHTSYQINRRINQSTFPIGMIQEFGTHLYRTY